MTERTALRAPHAARATRVEFGPDVLVVISAPVLGHALPVCLTEAQRTIARRVLSGASTSEIAALRGVSARTVANQISAIFKKLGVHSRAELSAQLARSES